jgi:PAS domain S-box-containing protein
MARPRAPDVADALERLPLPVFTIRRDQTIQWLNASARSIVGDLTGRRFTDAVAPESQQTVRDAFARKLLGRTPATEYEAVLLRPDGSRIRVEITSVPLEEGGHMVGVFGVALVEGPATPPPRAHEMLTPREAEALQLLARGCSTEQMSEAMGISTETVRNHIRHLLGKLGAHSRLEAVLTGRESGLVA